nr:hypothetical protein [Tanacetum cinerariifolium]
MEHYPHLDNGIYDVVERVMHPLALRQARRPRSDRGKALHPVSLTFSHHNHGSSSRQELMIVFDAPLVHISRLNPFGCAKLTTFVVMCKAYGCEPSVDLFQGFFNLCQTGKWLTFAKRSEKHISNLLPKVITRIEGWYEQFFYVQDSIIPAKYPQLLSEQIKLDSKSFKDKLPPNIEENPMFQHLSRYPTLRIFPNPILFLAGLKPLWEHEMAFRNFIYTKDDKDLTFLHKEPSLGFGTGSPSVSVNTEPLKANEEPDSQSMGVVKALVKRKLAFGSYTSRATRVKTSSSKNDAPFLTVSDDDEGLLDVLELKDANACHLKISAITPLLMGECNVMRSKERASEEECEGLRVKCEAGYQQILLTLESKVTAFETEKARLEAVEVSLRKELVSSAIVYGRCRAFEQVAGMKEPFDLSKRSAKNPYQKCFSSFELIVRGTPNLHTTYSYTNLSACLPFITIRGFASTHFMECSMAIAKNLKPPGAIGRNLRVPPLRCHQYVVKLQSEAIRYARSCSCRSPSKPLWPSLLSTSKKGSYLSAPFNRKRMRAAIFPLRLCTSLGVFGCLTSVMAFTFEGLARIPCLVMRFPKNGPSSMLKEHFFGLSFILIDQNFLKVSFISTNISSSDVLLITMSSTYTLRFLPI